MNGVEKNTGLQTRRVYSDAEQADWVKRWRDSGLTKKAFCEHYQLSAKTLSRWVSKLSPSKPKTAFACIEALSSPLRSTSTEIIQLRTARGDQLQIAVGTSPSYVASLLKALSD